jgi:hypothetical protein
MPPKSFRVLREALVAEALLEDWRSFVYLSLGYALFDVHQGRVARQPLVLAVKGDNRESAV